MDWFGFMQAMIVDEKGARAKYQLAVDMAEDPKVRAVFERLRDEEAFHVSFLENEYARLKESIG